jgi:hypothetical protein
VGFFAFINHWWNFPFLVMLGLVAVFFVLQVVGLIGHHGDHDVAHDHDHHHDVDHHVEAHPGFGDTLLTFFGFGRVPFMVIWVSLFLVGGFAGLVVNRFFYLDNGGAYPGWAFAVALGVSLAAGLTATAVAARLAGKLVDTGGKGASAKAELTGKLGTVASAHLDEKFGEVRVADERGLEMLVHARLGPGEPSLTRGARVVLIEYDAAKDLFWATASPADVQAI